MSIRNQRDLFDPVRIERRRTAFRRAVISFLVLVPLLSVLAWTFLGLAAFSALENIDTHGGLKPILESFWCGEPGCTE